MTRALMQLGLLAVILILPSLPAGGENPEPSETVIILPYIALGGEKAGWHFMTGLSLRNGRPAPQTVSVEIFDNEWDPLPVIVNGESELPRPATWIIPAENSREFVLTHPGGALLGGWLRLSSEESSALQVIAIARFYNGDALILETGVSTNFSRQSSAEFRKVSWGAPLPLELRNVPLLRRGRQRYRLT